MPLLTDTIAFSQFPEWSMAYGGPPQSADEAVARVTRGLSSSIADQIARGLVTFMSQMLEAKAPSRGAGRLRQVIRILDRERAQPPPEAAGKPASAINFHSAISAAASLLSSVERSTT